VRGAPLAGITFGLGAAALAILAFGISRAGAAEVRVFTSAASAEAQKIYSGKFAKATGNHVTLTVGTVRDIQDRLGGPDKPDVVVLPGPLMDRFEEAGTFRPGTRTDLARVGVGIAVRSGSRTPDISTADTVRKTLLAARSIVHPDPAGGGVAGAQIARMFERLGIADALRPKVKLSYAFAGGVEQVANGEAEIGLFNISEILPVKGVRLVGPLPSELQSYIVFSGAVHVDSTAPEPAAAYVQALASAGARETWRKAGLETLEISH
jgi:molybdate transport system substrate-binding protein